MRTIIVAVALTIKDDSPNPAGTVDASGFLDYLTGYAEEAAVVAVLDREHPEHNVEVQLFTDYAPCSACDCGEGVAFRFVPTEDRAVAYRPACPHERS